MNNKPILLVEDNPNDIELTKLAFAKEKIPNEIIVKEDGRQVLDFFFGGDNGSELKNEDLPAFVLLDLKLPGIDGLEVLRRLRKNNLTRRLPIIILTSSNEEQDLAKAYDLGANSYIRKPVDFTVFREALRILIAFWLNVNEYPPAR